MNFKFLLPILIFKILFHSSNPLIYNGKYDKISGLPSQIELLVSIGSIFG